MSTSLVIQPREIHATTEKAALAEGYTPLQSRIIAGRLNTDYAGDIKRQIHPTREDLDGPEGLPDIDRAADRVAKAIMSGEPLIVFSDHDCDGGTAHAVLRESLIDIFQTPPHQVHSFISHRKTEGYGLSDSVVNRILAAGHNCGVMVTADLGSSDEFRIKRLRDHGITVIVTDHHEFPIEGPPASAFATVSPIREDSRYPDKLIAGCHTAWLLMVAVRERLITRGHLTQNAPSLHSLLDFVSLGSIVDCMSIGRSRNNRRLIRHGLYLINERPRPCWQALSLITKKTSPWTAEDHSFLAGPRVNSQGRLDDQMLGVKFLRAPTFELANRIALVLEANNVERKEIENGMKAEATAQALSQIAAGRNGLTIYLPDGHPGVHGIVASRLCESFGRPVIILSPKYGQEEILSGSVRTIAGVHARNALQCIAEAHPGIYISMGGHSGAAGLAIHRQRLSDIETAWDAAVTQCGAVLGPKILTDGALPPNVGMSLLTEINAIAPYGREFEAPIFHQRMKVFEAHPVGDGTHLKMTVGDSHQKYPAIWFRALEKTTQNDTNISVPTLPIEIGRECNVAFTLDANTYRGKTDLQLMVKAVNN